MALLCFPSMRFLPLTSLVYLLLVLPSIDAFHHVGVLKPTAAGRALSPAARDWSRLVNPNAFFFDRYATTSRSATSLSSFQIRSIFRSEETATTEATSGGTQSPPTRSASASGSSSSSIKSFLTDGPQTALQSLASVQVASTAARKIKGASRTITALQLSEGIDSILSFILKYWWSLPTFLALVPLYTTYISGVGDAAMPHWWPVTRMDHIVSAPDAALVVGFFLLSNIAYFVSGAYLVKKFPFVRPTTTASSSSRIASMPANAALVSSSSVGSIISAAVLTFKAKLHSLKMVPTRETWLGLLLLSAGVISTVFHTEQALGSFAIANSLCYIDHAVAGTSTFYYFHTCGTPSKKVLVLGVLGLAALSIPHSAYAWLHSAWHFLSAAAATLWALESFDQTTTTSCMVEAIAMPDTEE